MHPKGPNNAQGATYGIVGDKDGNGYWTQMAFDTIVKANLATGETTELKLPPVKDEMARATAADMTFYDSYGPRDIGTPFPWSQGPRRIGIDRENGVLWVANSWSGTLARVDAKTMQTTLIPLPNTFTNQPYAAIPDKKQNVWARCGPPTRSPNTIPVAASGPCSTCRPAAPRCESPRSWSAATPSTWCSPMRGRARSRC